MSGFIGQDAFEVNHRLLRKERIGRQTRHLVGCKAGDRSVLGVFDLRHVLLFVIDRLDHGPLDIFLVLVWPQRSPFSHLGIGQHAVPGVLSLGLVLSGSEAVNLNKSVFNMAEIIRLQNN